MSDTVEEFSRTFYKFLHHERETSEELMTGLRFSLLEKARESVEVKTRFFGENADSILAASRAMPGSSQRGHKMLVCGNGGSATDAEHIAVEFMHPITVGRKALPVISLTNDTAMITAVANDVGVADVFSRQVIALSAKGDILLALSTSGNSGNLTHAIETAHRRGLVTIGYPGADAGQMAELHRERVLDFCLIVPTSSIHRIQETHVALYHTMWDMVHEFLQHPSLLDDHQAESQ